MDRVTVDELESNKLTNTKLEANVAEVLVREVILAVLGYHCPYIQIKDESTVFSEMCKLLGIKNTRSTPLHSWHGGEV